MRRLQNHQKKREQLKRKLPQKRKQLQKNLPSKRQLKISIEI
jgi:hypothetical protein